MAQFDAGRRLDRYGPSRHPGGCRAVRRSGRGFGAQAPGSIVHAMNQLAPHAYARVESAIRPATDAILAQQRPDGHWIYELEADATIPAEYVLLVHYLAEA